MADCTGSDLCSSAGFCIGSVCDGGTCQLNGGTAYTCTSTSADSGASKDAVADSRTDAPTVHDAHSDSTVHDAHSDSTVHDARSDSTSKDAFADSMLNDAREDAPLGSEASADVAVDQ
jgi:hypothetical protein